MNQLELLHFENDELLATAAAVRFAAFLKHRHLAGIQTHVAFPGGRIVARFFSECAMLAAIVPDPFRAAHYFWGDERLVPAEDPDSNYSLARSHLLTPLAVPEKNIHRIQGELPHAEAAAAAERELRAVVGARGVLDLIILGMGEDGHVASLFPNVVPAYSPQALYIPVTGPKPPPKRVSLTFEAIAAATEVWVLASGKGKEQALATSISTSGTTPLAKVLRMRKGTIVFTDILALA